VFHKKKGGIFMEAKFIIIIIFGLINIFNIFIYTKYILFGRLIKAKVVDFKREEAYDRRKKYKYLFQFKDINGNLKKIWENRFRKEILHINNIQYIGVFKDKDIYFFSPGYVIFTILFALITISIILKVFF
jgi:hypothetical protein